TKKHNNICPKCNRKLTIGVLNRVHELSDRPDGYHAEGRVPFHYIVPLDEIIAKSLGMGTASQKVKSAYENIIKIFGGEFKILMEKGLDELSHEGINPKIISGIAALREGKVRFDPPGFDGEYGNMVFTDSENIQKFTTQKSLF
ncbi:MAG: DNA helicase UvrD, partial [Candidatus Azambacteria bacterium]|nr:DNA helicase UvrD [Candidatus Azambacteria bacterium]